MNTGSVYWITGLSNVGKTTLGRLLVEDLRERGRAAVHLDGDVLREVYGEEGRYDLAARKEIAARNGRLCRLIASQGIDVVCSTISLFHEVQSWNRANIPGYREILLTAPLAVLRARDTRGVYSQGAVAGVDLAAEVPATPDLSLESGGDRTPQELLEQVRNAFF